MSSRRKTVLVVFVPLLLFSIVFTLWAIRAYPQTKQEDQDMLSLYEHSPGCVSSAPSSPSTEPCSRISETVIRKSFVLGRRSYGDLYYVMLQPANGATHKVRLLREDFWQDLSVGETIQTKNWEGEVVSVYAHGDFATTPQNPLRVNGGIYPWIALGILGILFWGGLLAMGLRNNPY